MTLAITEADARRNFEDEEDIVVFDESWYCLYERMDKQTARVDGCQEHGLNLFAMQKLDQ
jgi:hypothetical protein